MGACVRILVFGGCLLMATGCTMCPDPFDYSGPVPNGSVTQNDFAARSNGILPVRATPLPWPPFVQSAPHEPTLADEPASTAVLVSVDDDVPADEGFLGGDEPPAEYPSADGARIAVDPGHSLEIRDTSAASVFAAAPSSQKPSQPANTNGSGWRAAARSLFRR
ncbi:MAG: hypothetical protein DWH79_06070 [Planctomycetota bacterium]|nr:MAG: hypothetical protein DWH79_06070 [Planctomycetota bacterium]